jgi:hypothetical protein
MSFFSNTGERFKKFWGLDGTVPASSSERAASLAPAPSSTREDNFRALRATPSAGRVSSTSTKESFMTGEISDKTFSVGSEGASVLSRHSMDTDKETILSDVTLKKENTSTSYPRTYDAVLDDGSETTVTINVVTYASSKCIKDLRSASTLVSISWDSMVRPIKWDGQSNDGIKCHVEVVFDIMVDPCENHATAQVTVRTKREEMTRGTSDELMSIPIKFKGDAIQLKKRIVHAHTAVASYWSQKLQSLKPKKDVKKVLVTLKSEINAAISEAANRYTDNQIAALLS